MRFLRDLLISVLPPRATTAMPQHEAGSAPAVFDRVYRERRWGRQLSRRYFSGLGSHDPEIVKPYVAAVRQFLATLDTRPDVVDLGCGDFNVGRQLRDACGQYIACDVVADLIAYNRTAFAAANVEFRCLDMIAEGLPGGDVAFLRQVLQHLTNAQIAKVLPKLAQYRYLVLTEHVPVDAQFAPNAEHVAGSGTRLTQNSGVVIDAAPFLFPYRSKREICSVEKYGGLVKTIVYRIS
jgi:SAM-dependent methyltransferase